ncbi:MULTISPECIES: hypothetical protein [unclassified Thioalkalivibrio]|uniref:phage tail tube protein n=1 Tax=unclassified Thioalkalivibrio TaxID=2621013 RepID=UPI00035DF0B7|nr:MULTISPECIES: hypothetical protein [unclassified Thioalkalivibrio]
MSEIITEDYSHLGVGELYIRRRGYAGPMRPVGNMNELAFNIEQNTITQNEFRSPGGGARNEIRRITSVQASMQVFDLSPENIAIALYGDATSKAATDTNKREETVTAYKGGLIPLDMTNPQSVTVEPTEGTDTYEAGTDYIVQTGGVLIPSDSSIADGTEIVIKYHHGKHHVVEAMMNSGYEFEASFRGYNEARSKHFAVDIWRMRFAPTEGLGIVGEEFANLTLNPTILSDTSRPTGTSQFFRTVIED